MIDFSDEAPARIVAMCEVKGRVFVATERSVHELVDGIWRRMLFAVDGEPEPIEPPPEGMSIDRSPNDWWKNS